MPDQLCKGFDTKLGCPDKAPAGKRGGMCQVCRAERRAVVARAYWKKNGHKANRNAGASCKMEDVQQARQLRPAVFSPRLGANIVDQYIRLAV